MILFVGQIAREMREREAFQELDYRAVFGTMAKWATEIDDPARIPELISRAFYTATSGRPGPVVIALPEDMLVERIAVPDAPAFEPVETWPGATDMSRLQKLLWAAERPIVLLGGSRWSEPACAAVARFARALRAAGRDHVPPRASVRSGPSLLRRRSRHRAQSQAPGAREGAPISSCWSAAGWARCPRRATRCSTFRGRARRSSMYYPGVEELGRVYRPHLADQRRADRFCRGARRPAAAGRVALAAGKRRSRMPTILAWTDKPTNVPGRGQSRRDCRGIARQASRRRGDLQRRRQFLHLGAPLLRATADTAPQLAPISGSMGYGDAGGDRHEAAGAGSHGRRLCRRRRFPDDRTGVRNRRAIRPAGHRHRGRQRHVRHHPHASGAPLSRPRGRNRV